MAYVDTINSKRRVGTLALVGAIHVAAGYALVTGLAATVIPKLEDEFVSVFIPKPPEPAPIPTVTPRKKPDETTLAPRPPQPQEANPSQNSGPIALPSYGADDGGRSTIGEVTFPEPLPSPNPSFVTRSARPKGNPGLWVSTNDYPQSAIRSGAEGVVKFRLSIGTNGRVTSCEVTGSSGSTALDEAACAKLSSRGRFEPASDSTGALVAGSYTGAVRWQLPKE